MTSVREKGYFRGYKHYRIWDRSYEWIRSISLTIAWGWTRESLNKGVLSRFENLLDHYFESERPRTIGLPSVQYCADQLHLSANYFADLIKKETGKSAQEQIQSALIGKAKSMFYDAEKTVSEVAYELGFKYPHHLSRLFKKVTGFTPNEYRLGRSS